MDDSAPSLTPARDAESDRIRNVCVVAHINAGKTTLVERVLFDSGRQRHCGDVDAGTATMDWLPEEQARGISIGAGVSRIGWRDHRIHVVDTPGHVDFGAEVARVLRVVDGAVVVVDGIRGVEPQTEAVWRALDAAGLPRLVFVNKLDRDTADFDTALATLARAFPGPVWLPLVVPLPGVVDRVGGLGDVLGGGRLAWGVDEGVAATALRGWRDVLVERVADLDPAVFAAVVDGPGPTAAELVASIRARTSDCVAVPVLCGSALENRGVDALLDAVLRYLPPPRGDAAGDLRGLVFQAAEVAAGDYEGLVRLTRGALRVGDEVEVVAASVERCVVRGLAEPHGPARRPIEAAHAGDLIAVTAARPLPIGATIRSLGSAYCFEATTRESPVLRVRLEPEAAADFDVLERTARRVAAVDPSLAIECDPAAGSLAIAGMGELHLEVFAERLRTASPAPVRVGRPTVRDHITVAGTGVASADCQRRLGDRVLRAAAEVAAEPAHDREPPRVRWAVPGYRGTPDEVREAVAGLEREARTGLSGGDPVAGVVFEVRRAAAGAAGDFDLSLLHEAIVLAARRAIEVAQPRRLRPWAGILVRVPPTASGPVLADLRARRADVRAVRSGLDVVEIEAGVELGQLVGWATRLRSLSQGRGGFEQWPEGLRLTTDAASAEP